MKISKKKIINILNGEIKNIPTNIIQEILIKYENILKENVNYYSLMNKKEREKNIADRIFNDIKK